jgi:hypothetical protein
MIDLIFLIIEIFIYVFTFYLLILYLFELLDLFFCLFISIGIFL